MKIIKSTILVALQLAILMTVCGQDGSITVDSANIGLTVYKTTATALFVRSAGYHGVGIDTTVSDGFFINNAGRNGLNVRDAKLYGVRVYGKSGNYFRGDKGTGKADIIVGGVNNGQNSGDDAVITSDPDLSSSDLFLQANDAVIARINNNKDGNGNFFVWDGNNTNLFQVQADGTVRVKGTTVHGSDINSKENIDDLIYSEVLESVNEMPIYEWQYKGQDRRHIGPMAQDFHKAFGLGKDDTTIAAIDADGVALAAIKAQQEIIEDLKKEIGILNQTVSDLSNEVKSLERKHQKKRSR
ncbi:MAG: tail fiber domain-containing protein [Saprospiraceae bacterium]|nr:tail fiber domain-containing protein [Saprospiraceae bacterium]